ncbi:MAG: type II toxin-antitoxin system RelE/ParE family toxin [Gammaproteobacteria bacterium]|nr:type II toxin-antitoxin system RelE/ParE family toxin [Gammaproteobacteria bacterium]MCZ6798224.1 type II toxin-antitoxin system RelE/ParE family toxin [Gammaproteobacteria bacterium]MCZ6882975.1 type II toxin-antitoxin system RelE/ParE family toxin [Gammaproteobacteria bacterium]
MKYRIAAADSFNKWFKRLKDTAIKQRILARFARIENGNFGDFKRVDTDLFELRFFFGGGLRIYYTIRDERIVLLLKGGDKSNQDKDIQQAKQFLDELE